MSGKRWISWILIFMLGQWAAGEEEMYIRVVSRDALPAAQEEKLRVRDAVLQLIECQGSIVLSDIEKKANETAPCRVEIRRWGPEGGQPAPTLYITIGEGAGPNWWGILYPKGAALAGEETGEEGIRLVWPLWDWIKALLGYR